MIPSINFLTEVPLASELCVGRYDPLLVALSLIISITAAYAAIDVAGQMRRSSGRIVRGAWLLVGTIALGGGIWAMHFVGMLAFELPCGVKYDPLLTLVSMIPGFLAAAVTLSVISRQEFSPARLLLGGVLLGLGISGMHYAGMAAMKMDALLRYEPKFFFLSIVLAILFSVLALWIKFGLRKFAKYGFVTSLAAAIVMGLAISGMHYVAMSGAYFVLGRAIVSGTSDITSGLLAGAVALVSGLMISIVIVAAIANRFYGYSRKLARAIDDRRAAEAELQLAAIAFNNSAEGMLITDANRKIVSVNRAFTAITGYEAADVIGNTPKMLQSGHHDIDFYQLLWRQLAATGSWQGEIWNRRKDGHIYPEWLSISAIRDDQGKVIHYVAVFSDLTARKATEARIEHLVNRDALTALPNRTLLKDRLEHAIAHASRTSSRVAFLSLDIDNFKTINDSLGHAVGDKLLRVLADRLAECVRDTDTVSRASGDEFFVVLADMPDTDAITTVVNSILQSLGQFLELDGNELTTSVSIGIAVYPEDGDNFETLLKKSDTAIRHAKEAGRNTYRFYAQQMNVDAGEHLLIRNGLRRALELHEFVVEFQPQLDLITGCVVGAEALVRWRHPERGLIAPGRFIPMAEASGLIVPIGDWVLGEACRQAVAWQKAGMAPIVVAVNLSAVQFRRGDLEASVARALSESGLEPSLLELELTESILIHDTDMVLATVRRLKSIGVKLSIDDFGTGYSSLAYVKRFAVDKLKIDQSFIRDLVHTSEDAAIVRAIVEMAHSLNLKTIAEGVEDEQMVSYLKQLRCDEAQGYYFARPMPSADLLSYLGQRQRLTV